MKIADIHVTVFRLPRLMGISRVRLTVDANPV